MRKTANKIKRLIKRHPNPFITDEAYQLATLKYAPEMAEVIWEIKSAFNKGIAPEPADDSNYDTFFLKGLDCKPLAVFKTYHSMREYAAFRLDYKNFAGVPPTVLTTLDHSLWGGKKMGSCQLFVKESVVAIHLDRDLFARFSPASVRKIASLDVRIMNEDRHTSNLLVQNLNQLIPIDHGFTFGQDLADIHMGWMEFDQAKTLFSESELTYISLLDPEEDRFVLLNELNFEQKLANRMYVATILLKYAAARGLSPFQLGIIMTRQSLNQRIHPYNRKPSSFECLIQALKGRNAHNWTHFRRYVYEEVERVVEEYEK